MNLYFLWKSEYSQNILSNSECSDTKNWQSLSVNLNSKFTTFWEVVFILIHATSWHLMSYPNQEAIFFDGRQKRTDMLLPQNIRTDALLFLWRKIMLAWWVAIFHKVSRVGTLNKFVFYFKSYFVMCKFK